MIAADFSNYQRVPTDADIAALKALGVTRVIIGSSFGAQADAQIAACEAAGFEVQEYQFIGHLKPTTRRWWLDVELAESMADIRTTVATAKPWGIYTRRGIWQAFGWDIVAEFPWLKLWTANYGPLPRPFVPYGGWVAPSMVQYADTTDIGTGLEVDLSWYEEDALTPEQMQELKDTIVAQGNETRLYTFGRFIALIAWLQAQKPVTP